MQAERISSVGAFSIFKKKLSSQQFFEQLPAVAKRRGRRKNMKDFNHKWRTLAHNFTPKIGVFVGKIRVLSRLNSNFQPKTLLIIVSEISRIKYGENQEDFMKFMP